MVAKIIRDYIEGGAARLTVPGFGTFMRKASGEVIFVDLLRTDDGVLCDLVEDYGRLTQLEAMGVVDRFVFEARNGIEKNGNVVLEDFGVMSKDAAGKYQFEYKPVARPVAETAVQEELWGDNNVAADGARRAVGDARRPSGSAHSRASEYSQSQSPEHSRSYNRSRHGSRASEQSRSRQRSHNGSRVSAPPDKKTDTIMIVAVVAAIIAIVVMAFAFSAGSMPFLS